MADESGRKKRSFGDIRVALRTEHDGAVTYQIVTEEIFDTTVDAERWIKNEAQGLDLGDGEDGVKNVVNLSIIRQVKDYRIKKEVQHVVSMDEV